MSSNRQLSVIVLLIIASLIGLSVLFVRKAFMFSCAQTDPAVCKFLENYSHMSKRPMEGLYTVMNQNDESTNIIFWQKDNNNRAISAIQEGETILEAVISEDYLYLKDYTDNKWWKQKITNTPLSESYLPFDPYRYFIELEPILFDPQTIYTFIGKAKCGDADCIRYKVTSPKSSKDLQRFIYVTSDNQISIVVDANTSSSHEIKMSFSNKLISEPQETKIATEDTNIFLDYVTRREKEREKKLEYLKEFQSVREKVEGVPIEKLDSKSATSSAQ